MFVLLRPFSFLTIKHQSNLPVWVNWVGPAFVSVAITLGVCFFATGVNIYGPMGLIDRLLSFVQTLAGFYIAALAAVSSFNSPHLDKEMPKPSPTMWISHNGNTQKIRATRRRFLTSMFAYLTAVSFLFTIAAISALVLAPILINALPPKILFLRLFGLVCFLFVLLQMTLVTFWGLFYLGERMLTPD